MNPDLEGWRVAASFFCFVAAFILMVKDKKGWGWLILAGLVIL